MPASPASLRFDLSAVEAGIAHTRFARLVQHFPSTPSTSTLALEAAQAGTPGGVWVADEQTAGRGRGGHTWHSAPGDGLYVSVLVRPSLPLARALWLSLATGLAAQAAIALVTGLTPDIRWPNDLLLSGKKCGGILVETAIDAQTEPAALRYAVIGIGINVNHAAFPPELAAVATSLYQQTSETCSRERLLSHLLITLDSELQLLQSDPNMLLDRFAQSSTWITGKCVHVGEDEGYTGTTAGLNPDGFLLIDGDDGHRHTVLSGGVRALS